MAVPVAVPVAEPPRRPGRRDRHGRGLRGPLAPPAVPVSRTRQQRFDDLVLDAVERLEPSVGPELAGVDFAVEEVPPPAEGGWEGDVPLGRVDRGRGSLPPRVVVYRRPVEMRAPLPGECAALVHDVVVEQVADLLGRPPEQIDPGY